MAAAPRQRALVTGASNGIGLELARVLAREGWDLAQSQEFGDGCRARSERDEQG